jgi:hypothetical protein
VVALWLVLKVERFRIKQDKLSSENREANKDHIAIIISVCFANTTIYDLGGSLNCAQ